MWKKPAEAKPSSQPAEATASTEAKLQTLVPEAAAPLAASAAATPANPSVPMAPVAQPATPVSVVHQAPRGVSRISSGIRIKGEITGNDDLYIDGQAEGQFRFPQSKVTVGPNGKVQANIEAREIVVEGTVNGDLKASAGVQLGASSRVQGSLSTPRIAIDDGARLRGKVEMTRANGAQPELKAAQTTTEAAAKVEEAPRAIAASTGE